MSEEQAEYITDANEMLGAGYHEPAVEIHPPQTVLIRRGRKMEEIDRAAFVKLSTSFKSELQELDEIALKVWLYIALSVNRKSGTANPGLRTIAQHTNFAVNTVRAAIDRLENQYGLLIVDKESRRYNIYTPTAYVSANRVSPDDTASETVSVDGKTVSANDKTVSARVILNQINQKNQNTQKKGDWIDGLMALQDPKTEQEIDEVENMLDRLEQELHVNIKRTGKNQGIAKRLVKEEKQGRTLDQWLLWLKSSEWRLANLHIYRDMERIWGEWPQAFVESEKRDDLPAYYQKYVPEKVNAVPAPPKPVGLK